MTCHAVGGMQVECHLQLLLMHPADEPLGVGDELSVPRPACPAVEVPVHVEDHHVKWDVVLMDFGDEIDEVLLRVALVFAVPVAQRIEGRHGLAASYLDVVGKGTFVVVAIAEEVVVEGISVDGLCHPRDAINRTVEGKRARAVAALRLWRLVEECPAGTREDAILEVRSLVVAAGGVKGALRAFQVERIFLSGIPRHDATVQRHRDAEVVRRLQTGRDGASDFIA